jgi:MFS family permease
MGSEGDQAQVASGLRVLSDRNFWPYFAGNLASNCGSWFQNLAQALLIFRLTGSTFLVGAVNFAQFAGAFVLAPWAGSAADRFDRRRLMIVTQVVSVVITAFLAMLAAADLATAPVVIVLALLLGACIAFYVPAMQALVPLLVPAHELAGAVALNSVTFNLARAIGPVVGALVIAHSGIAVAFGLNSVSYVVLIVGLLMVRPRPQAPRPQVRPRLRESIRLVLADAQLSALLIAVMALSVTTDPLNTLTPGFATELFNQPDTIVGWLIGAFGLGAVLAAFTTSRGVSNVWRRLSAMLTLEGAGMLAFALAPSLAFAFPVLLVSGFGYLAANTTATTALQLQVDDSQRGRVMALWSISFLGVRPVAALTDGGVASVTGLRFACALLALPSLACGIAFARRLRVRRASAVV